MGMILKRPPKIGPTHRLPCTVFRRYADFSEEQIYQNIPRSSSPFAI